MYNDIKKPRNQISNLNRILFWHLSEIINSKERVYIICKAYPGDSSFEYTPLAMCADIFTVFPISRLQNHISGIPNVYLTTKQVEINNLRGVFKIWTNECKWVIGWNIEKSLTTCTRNGAHKRYAFILITQKFYQLNDYNHLTSSNLVFNYFCVSLVNKSMIFSKIKISLSICITWKNFKIKIILFTQWASYYEGFKIIYWLLNYV